MHANIPCCSLSPSLSKKIVYDAGTDPASWVWGKILVIFGSQVSLRQWFLTFTNPPNTYVILQRKRILLMKAFIAIPNISFDLALGLQTFL